MEKDTRLIEKEIDKIHAQKIGRFILKDFINAEENNDNEKINIENILKLNENIENKKFNDKHFFLPPRITPALTDTTNFPELANPISGNEVSELPSSTSYLDRILAQLRIGDTTFNQLRELLKTVPQRNVNGYLLYLVTSGLSVELVTGYERRHKDVDLVLMHPDVNNHQEFLNTDNVEPRNFWAGMYLDPAFLTGTALKASVPKVGRKTEVYCAHPGITIVQKVSDAWGREPREHDIYDATALGYWMLSQPEIRQVRDVSIANVALNSMDYVKSSRTADRLNVMFANYGSIKQDIASRSRYRGRVGKHTRLSVPALA